MNKEIFPDFSKEDLEMLSENNRDIARQEKVSLPTIVALEELEKATKNLSREQLETVWSLMDGAAREVFKKTLKDLLLAEHSLPSTEIYMPPYPESNSKNTP